MAVRVVQSKQNARLKALRRALANPGREAEGLAGIEGPKLLEEALRAGLRIDCIFVAQGSEALLEPFHLPTEIEILLMPRELLDSVLATEAPQPVAALVEPPDWTWAHLLGGNSQAPTLILVLAGLQDPGNLGAMVRSAEAFGADGIVSFPGTVNAWNLKAVRASAGSIFRVPLLAATPAESIPRLRHAGIKILASTVRAAQPADLVDLTGPLALVIGNEGNGIPQELIAQSDGAVTIPCPGAVESLNAAVAASVMLYEAARQRSVQGGGRLNHLGGLR